MSMRSGFGIDRGTLRRGLALGVGAVAIAVATVGFVFPGTIAGDLLEIVTSESTLSSALRLSAPIAFAALGGIFAEKAGVINIGLEGLLILSAFVGVFTTSLLGNATLPVPNVWIGFFMAVLASTLLSLLFAVVCIEFRADQIIAGLAIWLIALGLAPFIATVYYGSVNSGSVAALSRVSIPVLSEIPYFGAIFRSDPSVYLLLLAVPLSWWVLNRTAFGRHIRASGENPRALDTAGVSVRRVRYAGVLLSGVLSGIGGASLSLSLGQFIGTGQTMVDGKGFIAIVAYLFGNYNPLGAFGASLLFAGLEAIQLRLQQVPGYMVPDSLIQTIPYVTVVVVLALVGRTRVPEAAGDHYDSGED
jgi:general nucleoside transport system permease protein